MYFSRQKATHTAGFLSVMILLIPNVSLSIAQQQNGVEIGEFLQREDVATPDKNGISQPGTVLFTAPDSSLFSDPPPAFFARTYTSPKSPKVTIEYNLPATWKVKIEAYSVDGSFSKTLVNEQQEAGNYKVYFDGSERASGLYICRIKANKEVWIEPMLLVK